MLRHRRRKCRHCGQPYQPDPRNRWHQRYCSKAECRRASKAYSQRRWRRSIKGRDYFSGPANVVRVNAWRRTHPGYWRKHRRSKIALQDRSFQQLLGNLEDKPRLNAHALQDFVNTQGSLLVGLVANLSPSPLQENIASTTRRLILLGRQVRGLDWGRRSNAGKASCFG
jgi:hypothetical protein